MLIFLLTLGCQTIILIHNNINYRNLTKTVVYIDERSQVGVTFLTQSGGLEK